MRFMRRYVVSKRKQALNNFLSVERIVCMNSFSSYTSMSRVGYNFNTYKTCFASILRSLDLMILIAADTFIHFKFVSVLAVPTTGDKYFQTLKCSSEEFKIICLQEFTSDACFKCLSYSLREISVGEPCKL